MAYQGLDKTDLARAAFSAAAQVRERWMEQLTSSMADNWAIHHLIKLGRFAEAADEFAQAVEFAPSDCNLWSFVATAQCAAGNADAYRKTCSEVIDRFARDANGRDAFILAWTCTLLPDALPHMQVLAPVAETGAQWWFDSERGLLATYNRLGRYQDAIQSFDRLAEVARPMPSALVFAAMAHKQLGQHEKAQQRLAEAAAAVAEPLEGAITPMPDPGIDMRSWQDKISEPLLRKEAYALILGRSI